jgi:hypothetical protein
VKNPEPKFYLCGKVAFVPYPADPHLWMRVDPAVVWADCSACGADKGEPCKDQTFLYPRTQTHLRRRQAAKRNKQTFGRRIINAEIRP